MVQAHSEDDQSWHGAVGDENHENGRVSASIRGPEQDKNVPAPCDGLFRGSGPDYSVFRSSCIVSCGLEVVGAFGGREDVDEAPDGGPKAVDGALRGFPEQSFEFSKGVLDRVEIRAV